MHSTKSSAVSHQRRPAPRRAIASRNHRYPASSVTRHSPKQVASVVRLHNQNFHSRVRSNFPTPQHHSKITQEVQNRPAAQFFTSLKNGFQKVMSQGKQLSSEYDSFVAEQEESARRAKLVERVSTRRPTAGHEDEAKYQQMVQNHKNRYEQGELAAMMEKRKQQMQNDEFDTGVLHLSPNDATSVLNQELQEKLDQIGALGERHNYPTSTAEHGQTISQEIQVVTKPDGTMEFVAVKTGDHQPLQQPAGHQHTKDGNDKSNVSNGGITLGQIADPRLLMSFTCDVCDTKLVKSIPKSSYERGVVLIRCDGCKSDHLIADNLGWFDDSKALRIENIMQAKGQPVIHASVSNDQMANMDESTRQRIEEMVKIAHEHDKQIKNPILRHFQDENQPIHDSIPLLPASSMKTNQ